MSKYINADKLIAEIERRKYEVFPTNDGKVRVCATPNQIQSGWLNALKWVRDTIASLQQEQPEVSVECYVRVYPTLDNKPRPWVSLCKHGISCNSIRDIPELESLGFKDDDTAIVTIKKK